MLKKEGKKSVGKLKRRKKLKSKNQIPSKQTKIQKVITYI